VQPLLQNFGWDFTYLVVHVAERTADASLYQYEAQLADFVEQVIETYWNVVGARETLEVQRESKGLADRTVEENQARVRVGLLPPVATLEAQADAKSREEQVIIAENNLALTRQQLAQLAYYRPDGTFVPRTLEPVEEATPEDVAVDLDETLAVALVERPEIEASARGVEAQQLNEKIAGNALLPRLDVAGSYGVNGLSGRNRPLSSPEIVISSVDLGGGRCSPIPSTTGEPRFLCRVTVTAPASPFAGPRSDAYDRLTSNDFRSYSFGLQFQVPLSNASARGQYTQSRIARDQAELNHRELLSRVTLEARQTVADVITTRQRIDTTRVARELAEENLRNQQKRHEVGMATTKDLLDFQTRLTTARAAEVQAKIDHAIAVARWRRAKGELLAHYQVLVEQPGQHSPPWFARF
jgi:outer membrane protein TolC